MLHPGFFENKGPFPAADLAKVVGAELAPGADGARAIFDVRALADAGNSDVSFLDNRKYLPQLDATGAGFVLVQPAFAARVPSHAAALVTQAPYRSFALALAEILSGSAGAEGGHRHVGLRRRSQRADRGRCGHRAWSDRRAGSDDWARQPDRGRRRHRLSGRHRAGLLHRTLSRRSCTR